ncbi:MAG: acyl-CoA dehydrogenase family protein [Candidatus Taylorbacteria bacterium]|nr:acyl-CoA dehydrogenase family protein [Candidatus Taylorbacteria bacterium]
MASKELNEAKKLLALAASVEGKPSFLMKLAQGRFDAGSLADFKIQSTSEKFNHLKAWLDDFLNNQFDPIEVRKNSKIPREVFNQLGSKLLGAKIKTQYGGLELNTLEYCLIMRTLSSHCSALGIWYTANCSIGLSGYLMVVYDSLKKELKEAKDSVSKREVEALMANVEWQMKEFLPKLAAGANAGFGLTQQTAGSDPMAMIGTDTIAERMPDGKFHVRGHKLYNTGGTIAEYEVIMAPLLPHNSICTFIVPTSGYGEFKVTPCDFEGNRGIENGLIQFDVKIPESFLVGRDTGHDGLKNAFRTLNVGRLAMSAGSSAAIVNCLQISRWWCKERVQQKRPIGKYQVNAIRVAKMACDAFAVEAIMNLGSAMYDKQKQDVDLRLETAAVKLWSTERAIASARANEEVRSGHCYETYESQARRFGLVEPYEVPLPDDSFLSDAKVLWTGEGTNDIQKLIISGMIFAPHAFRLLPILDFKHPLKAFKAAITAMVYYFFWIPAKTAKMVLYGLNFLLMRFCSKIEDLLTVSDYDLKHEVGLEYIRYASNKLALKSFWLMVRYGSRLLREQVVTSFMAKQLTEFWVMSAVMWYAEQLRPKYGEIVDEIVEVHCEYAKCRVKGDAEDKPQSIDGKAYKLAQKIIFENAGAFLEKGVATVLDRELKRWGMA